MIKTYWEPWHIVRIVCFSHTQLYSAILRRIQALLRHIEPYLDIIRTLRNLCIYNYVIFRTLTHIEPEALQKPVKHVRSRYSGSWLSPNSLFKHFQGYLGIFRDIDAISATLTGVQLGGGRPPLSFSENQKKCPDFGKKGPNCVHLWVKFSIQKT